GQVHGHLVFDGLDRLVAPGWARRGIGSAAEAEAGADRARDRGRPQEASPAKRLPVLVGERTPSGAAFPHPPCHLLQWGGRSACEHRTMVAPVSVPDTYMTNIFWARAGYGSTRPSNRAKAAP